MVPIKVQLDNDDHYDGENTIEYIVVHGTGNKTDTDEGNANYFCSGSRQSSAHYFVDDDSITQLVLDINGAWHCGDGHNLYGINNHNSLGIEMCCTNYGYSDTTVANTIELVKQKMKQYNVPIEKVVRHFDASRKPCPSGFMENNWAKWYDFKSKLVDIPVQVTAPAKPQTVNVGIKSIANLQSILNMKRIRDKNGNPLIIDGLLGNLTLSALARPEAIVRRGDRNGLVGWIQAKLGTSVDNAYGNAPYHETYDAIVRFQKSRGLSSDGIVGPKTWAELVK